MTLMKLFSLGSLLGCTLLLAGAAAPAEAQTADSYLVVSGDANDSYTAGSGRFFTRGTWTAQAYDRNNDGPVDLVILSFQGMTEGDQRSDWVFWFGSDLPHRNLEPGFYSNANDADGYPMLFVGGEGFGDHAVGSFTVLDAAFDTTGGTLTVERFSVRFEYPAGPIYGVVSYQAPAKPYLTSATYTRAKQALSVSGERLSGLQALEVDGDRVPAKASKGGVVKVKGLALGTENHTIAGVFADGTRTPPLVVSFDLGLPGPGIDRSSVILEADTPDTPMFELHGPLQPIIGDGDGDGNIDVFHLFFNDPVNPSSVQWQLYFSVYGFGRQLVPGNFDHATGPLAPGGDAKLYVNSNIYECNYSTGSFRVLDAVVDSTRGYPRLVKFAATFEQECSEGGSKVHGSVTYYAPIRPVIARASYDSGAKRLVVSGLYFSKSAKLVVDGHERTPGSVTSKAITLDGVDLRGGVHAVYVKNRDGHVTQPFVIAP
jgi:hypothetical protein